jgi:hypothetical protein
MKLRILFEGEFDTTYEEIKEALQECVPFLKDFRTDFDDGYYIVRGMHENPPIIKKTTKEKRKPRDSAPSTHHGIDALFEKHLGHKFRSDKVAFCKIAHEDKGSGVSDYGHAYRIFPVGANYKFCYSTLVDDFYDNFDNNLIYKAVKRNSNMQKACADFFVAHFEKVLKVTKGTKLFKIDRTMIDENVANFADDLSCDYYNDSNKFAFTNLNFSEYVIQIKDDDHYDIAEHAAILDKFKSNFERYFSKHTVRAEFADVIFPFLEYTTELHALREACVESSHKGRIVEVMVNCDSYVAIRRDNVHYGHLMKAIKELTQ